MIEKPTSRPVQPGKSKSGSFHSKRFDKRASKGNSGFDKTKKPIDTQSRFSKDVEKLDAVDARTGIREDHGYSSKSNSPLWYAATPQILVDAASLSYNDALGTEMSMTNGGFDDYFDFIKVAGATRMNDSFVPGILCYYLFPSIGSSRTGTSAANIAAKNIFSYVVHGNSRTAPYEASDMLQYLVAMSSAHAFVMMLQRAYKVCLLYSQRNRYLPDVLLQSMGFDPQDMRSHVADFRSYINLLAVKLGSLVVPSSMPYFDRQRFVVSDIYKDSDTDKAQLYLYNYRGFYKYEFEAGVKASGYLEIVEWIKPSNLQNPSSLKKFSDVVSFGDALYESLIANEDINIMSGDILKVFGPDAIVRIPLVSENETLTPVYDLEILGQMENVTNLDLSDMDEYGYHFFKVEQGDNVITCDPFIVLGQGNTAEAANADSFKRLGLLANKFINSHSQSVSPADTMVNTRLTCFLGGRATYTLNSTVYNTARIIECGSEICTNVYIFRFGKTASDTKYTQALRIPSTYFSESKFEGTTKTAITNSDSYNDLSQFDWHLLLPVINSDTLDPLGTETNILSIKAPFGDLDVYTIIGENEIRKLHQCALVNEFSVPVMGLYAKKV